ncbi:hypothetical protein O6H91_14G046500 [Diphasiastrum complanatum]|uniref:Uncharacterized protein n=1 Tax=Diphasiastrum complanatum TaxID=34168 RepID=A0ACC2BP99_DIPCM|nr:hypothetical protein O6H91_14G046500 [Diphasiastrum complanatum]
MTSAAAPTLPTPIFQVTETFESTPQFTCSFKVEYPSEDLARIVGDVLSVDAELHLDKVKRDTIVVGRQLTVNFIASDARFLRASVSAFLDMLTLATRTIEEFGPSAAG